MLITEYYRKNKIMNTSNTQTVKIMGVNSTNCKNKRINCWTITQHKSYGRDVVGLFPTRLSARETLKALRSKISGTIMYQMHKSKLSIK